MTDHTMDLMLRLTRVEWLLARYHHRHHAHFGPMGNPQKGQGRVLAILKLQPEISQKELTYLLDMRPQSLGELLFKLEKSGYITRTPAESDNRVMNIRLTQAGLEAVEQREQGVDTNKLFACLNEEEQESLSGYLDRIIASLEAQVGNDPAEPGFPPPHHRGPFGGGGPGGNPFGPPPMPFGHPPHGCHHGPHHGMRPEEPDDESPDR